MAALRFPVLSGAALVALCLVTSPGPVAAAETDIGEAAAVVKSVRGTIAEKVRKLVAKDRIFADELIQTGADSASQIKFRDDTVMTIGPNSDVVLDEFVFDADPDKQKLVINASVGVLRFVTGRLNKTGFKIKAPTATIGVRGTDWTMTINEGSGDGTTPTIEISVKNGQLVVDVINPVTGQRESIQVQPGVTLIIRTNEAPVLTPSHTVGGQTLVAKMDALLMIEDGSVTTDETLRALLFQAKLGSVKLREDFKCACP